MQYTTLKHTTRFVKRHVVTGTLGVGLLISLTPSVRASVGATPVVTFTMPTAVDPAKLYLFVPGQLYTNTNDPSNPTGNGPITGLTLLPTQLGGLGGLEVHGRFVSPSSGASVPVVELDVMTDYPNPLLFNPISGLIDPNTGRPFVPWTATDQGFANNIHKVILAPQAGSAPMMQGGYYGVLSVDSTLNTAQFQQSHFSFVGNPGAPNTPEPGTAALLLGAGVVGVMLRRKSKRIIDATAIGSKFQPKG